MKKSDIFLFDLLGILHGFQTPYTEEMCLFQRNTCLRGTSNKRNGKDDWKLSNIFITNFMGAILVTCKYGEMYIFSLKGQL